MRSSNYHFVGDADRVFHPHPLLLSLPHDPKRRFQLIMHPNRGPRGNLRNVSRPLPYWLVKFWGHPTRRPLQPLTDWIILDEVIFRLDLPPLSLSLHPFSSTTSVSEKTRLTYPKQDPPNCVFLFFVRLRRVSRKGCKTSIFRK